MELLRRRWLWKSCLGMLLGCVPPRPDPAWSADLDPELQRQIRQLQQQNEAVQLQLQRQEALIEQLTRQLSTLQNTVTGSEAQSTIALPRGESRQLGPGPGTLTLGKLRVSGEGAMGLFHSQSDGQYPNSEFRVDEAKLFVEAPVWGDVYFFTELNLFTREEPNANLRAGELYLEVENLSRLWDQENQLNLRLGRIDIPFGEEYLTRDAIDDPLVSHSIMDFWGVDEGLELYGSIGKVGYVVAVQNGGHDALRDYTSDKAVAGRVGFQPATGLHLSVSALRTGDLDVNNDKLSELWLGSGFVRSLGGAGTTRFGAYAVQGDIQWQQPRTAVKAWGGMLAYDDNDPSANNRRHVYHYALEAEQNLYRGLYAVARWSQVFAPQGFGIAGQGDVKAYGFGPELTEELWRLSLGLGYRWNKSLLLKAEYSLERGRIVGGEHRNHEDLVAGVLAGSF